MWIRECRVCETNSLTPMSQSSRQLERILALDTPLRVYERYSYSAGIRSGAHPVRGGRLVPTASAGLG